MIEHSSHFLFPFILIFLTIIFKLRAQFKLSLIISLVLISFTFEGLFLHFDHQFIEHLGHSTHLCCILPAAVSIDFFIVAAILVVFGSYFYVSFENKSIMPLYSFYSRPPPNFS